MPLQRQKGLTRAARTSWRLKAHEDVIGLSSAQLLARPKDRPRWIEVWLSKDNLLVMTRSADEITNDIAAGLARIFARFWKGKYES